MCIHNFIIAQREPQDVDIDASALVQSSGGGQAEFEKWWSRTATGEALPGRRRDLELSGLRERLTEHLRLRGDVRPF
jgi:hypothetical protein